MSTKNIAEQDMSEVHDYLRRSQERCEPVTETELAAVVKGLNNKLRTGGLSSLEIWT